MDIRDSRRLTGPNLFLDGPGACLDVALDAPGDPSPAEAAAAWERVVARLLAAVGWGGAATATRTFDRGVSLAFAAPVDGLYAACEVNETAWAMAWTAEWAALAGSEDAQPTDEGEGGALDVADDVRDDRAADRVVRRADLDVVPRLRAAIAAEANPALVALARAAEARGVQCLIDPDDVSVGLGTGGRSWPVDAIPPVGAVAWSVVHDVPVALVTGTNGKSTTVRLAAAMARAAGRMAGVSTTDWVRVGDVVLDEGDWSGPGGARLALRDPRTEIAILECARGGMLRRGLAVTRADVAAITNVAADHLGDFGIGSVAELADVKRIVARVAARLVLNADDPVLVAGAEAMGPAPVTWFSLDPRNGVVAAALAGGGCAVVLDGGVIVVLDAGHGAAGGVARTDVVTLDEVPIAFGGAARHNAANALCAVGVAWGLGLPFGAIREGLASFGGAPEDNPGRLNVFEVGGCTVVVDYAHNPHGMLALADVVAALPGGRRLIVLGQAGDRSDDDLRDLAAAALAMRPDVVLVKELAEMLRGRPLGEVPRVLVAALRDLGVPDGAIERVDDELAGTRRALELAAEGDVIVLPIHKQREAVVALLRGLSETGWRAGEAIAG